MVAAGKVFDRNMKLFGDYFAQESNKESNNKESNKDTGESLSECATEN